MNKKQFMMVVEQVANLVDAKDKDYNTAVPQEQYFPFGHQSYVHILHTKTLRLVSLTARSATPKFESVEDTVKDTIAYAVFYLEWLGKERHLPPLRADAGEERRTVLEQQQRAFYDASASLEHAAAVNSSTATVILQADKMAAQLRLAMGLIERMRDSMPPVLHTIEMEAVLGQIRRQLEEFKGAVK